MDDTPAKNTPGDNINKLDLSALEAFQFGTQWDNSGDSKRPASDRQQDPRGREHPAPRRDRRPPRREGQRSESGPAVHGEAPPDRGFRSGGGGGHGGRDDRRGGGRPFRDSRDHQDERGGGGRGRFDRGHRGEHGGPRRPSGPPRPYQSPDFELTFYPDDHGFNALVKAMRASSRTYELFEIARLILGKLERCVVVFRRRMKEGETAAALFVSIPDGLPFPTEDEAISHALDVGLTQFFVTETVEVEPPKGSFQFVNRCPITKELLGPPNYHRYAQILQSHYSSRGIHMPFERYKASIEVVRDEEAVKSWLDSMKTATRYTFKGESPEGPAVFDNLEDARTFLLRACRDKLVRTMDSVRVAAKTVEAAGRTEAARAMNGMLDAQRRFPLDTANALRGRLRRENFHIFKRGSKGVTYVCAVRRKFRQPGQVFSDSINQLIEFLEKNPQVPAGELAPRMLNITPPATPPTPAATAAHAEAATETATTEEAQPVPPQASTPELTPEQKTALSRLALDLRWLVSEGYVAEYSDGRLFVHPIMEPEHPQQEQSEPTPESTPTPEAAAEPPPAETESSSAEAQPASHEAPAAEPADPAPEASTQLETASPSEPELGESSSEEAQEPEAETSEVGQPAHGQESPDDRSKSGD